jgi:hypothetical protein
LHKQISPKKQISANNGNQECQEHLRDVLVRDEIKREPRLRMSSPREALATILPDAPLVPLQRYLAAAERPDTYHNLQILALISNHR